MAVSYINQISDKLGKGSTAANLPKHIKEIAPIMYNDGSNNFNSIQTALNGKAASTHAHGNITGDGKVGTASGKPLITTTGGTVTAGSFGTSSGQFAEGNHNHDSRYYTESEVDTKLNEKASSYHTHGLTFSTSTGTPDYTLKAGDVISMSAGGTTKKIKIEPDYVNTLEDPFIPPDVAGSMWRNAQTGDIWIANGASSVNDWILVHNRIHDLIVQRQSVVISGHGNSRPILCDKQKYTTSVGGVITFARVDPYELAKWKNRGDVIQVGGEVDYDPWGDGYPMRITEYQASKDANDKWYCTNLNLRGYKYNSATEGSYWGNINHDEETDKDFIEFQSW